MTPKLTQAGYEIMTRALSGEQIVFKKIQIGNGNMPDDYLTASSLGNPMQDIEIDSIEVKPEYAVLTGNVTNANITEGFQWTEIGIFCEGADGGEDILYAYGHYQMDADGQPTYIPKFSNDVVELTLNEYIYIGEADDVTAALATSAEYATKSDLEEHETDSENPHQVTAEQVGLGNVPNVGTNDQTPTFAEADSLTRLTSGAKVSVLFGRLATAVSSLIDHLKDTTRHITANERNIWNGKASASHTHSANDINSGTLGLARGGTGAATAAAAIKALVGSSAIGSATNPVYWNGSAFARTTNTLEKSVPADAKFTDTTYGNASTSAAGLMTAAMVTKLNGIATGANAYSLPTAAPGTKGGAQMTAGKLAIGTVKASAYVDKSYTFKTGTFGGEPTVVITEYDEEAGTSLSGNTGRKVIILRKKETGFTVRAYNNANSDWSPNITFVAIYRG